jgi:integrase
MFSQLLFKYTADSTTLKQIAGAWIRAYDFACTIGYVNNVSFNYTLRNINLLRRYELIWFTKFDREVKSYIEDERYTMRVLIIFEEILFYTGLRESECYELKLEDIVLSEKTCDIIIRKGKTLNAKRIIPYHIFAPDAAVDRFKTYLSLRKKVDNCQIKTHVFGPENIAEPFDYNSFMRNLSNLVKNQFGEYFVPHLLRHSFQSLLVLRNIAIDLPEIINELPDKNHEMFSSTKIEELRNWIYDSNLKERGIFGKENTSMWHISKLMGHSNPAQGLYTYDHSFPFYQKLYLAKVERVRAKA